MKEIFFSKKRQVQYSNYMVFADDIQIYLDCMPSEIEQGMEKVRHDIYAISDYANANQLKLNLDKTKILILGSPAYINSINYHLLLRVSINETEIPCVTYARSLGVILQSNLSWSKHVTNISSRVYATLHRLKYQKNSLSTQLRTKLVATLIFPIFDYCCIVYVMT